MFSQSRPPSSSNNNKPLFVFGIKLQGWLLASGVLRTCSIPSQAQLLEPQSPHLPGMRGGQRREERSRYISQGPSSEFLRCSRGAKLRVRQSTGVGRRPREAGQGSCHPGSLVV